MSEFSKDALIPVDCWPVLTRLCLEILEPVRMKFLTALLVTSAYRPPEQNAEAHGIPNSEHIYSPTWAACDFLICNDSLEPRVVFNWMRYSPTLPFHQLILEHGQISTVIHVSVNTQKPGIRSVLEGATHNSEPYSKLDYAAYQPYSNRDAVQDASAEV